MAGDETGLHGNHRHPRRLFSRNRENLHGTEIFEKSLRRCRAGDEEAQGRDFEERALGAESHKPQAGDRDRSFRGKGGRKESPEESDGEEKDCEEKDCEENSKEISQEA